MAIKDKDQAGTGTRYLTVDSLGNHGNSSIPTIAPSSGFSSFISAIGVTEIEILITTAINITSNLTIPSNVSVRILKGGSFVISSGVTLTVNGGFSAGIYQVISGSGVISFGGGALSIIYPQWWGVIGGAGSVDDYAKIILCLSASSGRGKIWFPEGIYNLSQPLDIPVSNLDIDGSTQAFITAKTGGAFTSASDNWVFRINGLSNIKIRNICFDGNKSGNPTGRTFGVDVQGNCTNILFENVSFLNCPGSTSAGVLGGDGCRVGQTGYTPKNINFLECDFDGNVRTGLGLITGEGILVDGCTIRNTTCVLTDAGFMTTPEAEFLSFIITLSPWTWLEYLSPQIQFTVMALHHRHSAKSL
jgi:hypothetical protein